CTAAATSTTSATSTTDAFSSDPTFTISRTYIPHSRPGVADILYIGYVGYRLHEHEARCTRQDEEGPIGLQQRGVRARHEVREEEGPLRLHAREEVGAGVHGETHMIFYHVTRMGNEEGILHEWLEIRHGNRWRRREDLKWLP